MLSSPRAYFYRAEQSTDTELHHMVQQYNPKLNISKTIKCVLDTIEKNRQTRTKKLLSLESLYMFGYLANKAESARTRSCNHGIAQCLKHWWCCKPLQIQNSPTCSTCLHGRSLRSRISKCAQDYRHLLMGQNLSVHSWIMMLNNGQNFFFIDHYCITVKLTFELLYIKYRHFIIIYN